MNGIINVLKPPGMTSFDVVGFLRGVLKTRKIGHTGTLDPAAVGVLPICVGNATKTIEYMTDTDKKYRAEMTLGIETDTQDATGKVLAVHDAVVDRVQIEKVIQTFVGPISQIPPMYSAVKMQGKKLYELAREGITVAREPRNITIHSIDNIRHLEQGRVMFDVACSKGTYIRTLCHDIGQALGCGAHMSFLVRLQAGSFLLDHALTLEEIVQRADAGTLEEVFAREDTALTQFDAIELGEENIKRFVNGAFIHTWNKETVAGQIFRVYNFQRCFIGLGQYIDRDNALYFKSIKLFDRG